MLDSLFTTAVLSILVIVSFFKVHLSFPPVGHTHEDIDAKFAGVAEKCATTMQKLSKIYLTSWNTQKK